MHQNVISLDLHLKLVKDLKRFINNIKYFIISIVTLGIFIQGSRFEDNVIDDNQPINQLSSDSIFFQHLIKEGISFHAFQLAYSEYSALVKDGLVKNDSLLTIIDFDKPSSEDRLFIIDLKNKQLIRKTLVAHGMNSGLVTANDFSNQENSHKSSLGMYLTDDTYIGKHGYSLHLDGLEEGLNDNARKRAIVMHGANYVSEKYIQKNGRLGRSFGCPALSYAENEDIINLIKDKSCLFIYHNSYHSKLVADNQGTDF